MDTPLFELKIQWPPLPKNIRDMHRRHGLKPGKKCKDCIHLLRLQRNKTYFKCDLTRITLGAATDWRANHPACGAYEFNEGKRNYC